MPYITNFEQMLINQGIQQERQRGLLSAIELGLELKFGNEGLRLLPEISQIKDVEVLEAIKAGLRTVDNLNELRSIYQPHDTQN
ncbi:hypothetical protein F7734_57345 [Scytonema sp. UIC 10036]|uniref:hypothetical protein n=1 Tax=Scytonema sp. UIC 10036 TaxID=2304196 RepID=UPI0012DA8E9F|nr:hypothetical protein [Scytonema sp. UIC 10036]MUH01338.1 hypothetical protein [Scytonema sp. UIC 10036]